jgi:hypothetical protein
MLCFVEELVIEIPFGQRTMHITPSSPEIFDLFSDCVLAAPECER